MDAYWIASDMNRSRSEAGGCWIDAIELVLAQLSGALAARAYAPADLSTNEPMRSSAQRWQSNTSEGRIGFTRVLPRSSTITLKRRPRSRRNRRPRSLKCAARPWLKAALRGLEPCVFGRSGASISQQSGQCFSGANTRSHADDFPEAAHKQPPPNGWPGAADPERRSDGWLDEEDAAL